MSFEEQFPEDDEHAECRHEIHRLEAELERVKADRDDARQSADTQCQIRYMVDEELSSLKSRLPVNADGDVVLWGDEVWATDSTGEPFSIRVEEIEFDKGEFWVNAGWRMIKLTDCHSTAESCAANEKGENDEVREA